MLTYDPATNLRHWPMPMARFGQTPYAENLYRIIYAPSRRNLAGNETGFHWVPTYRHIGDMWVLERWRSAWDFAQCSKEKWERDLLILGPYPDRGEYDHVHTFETALPDQCNMEKLISWIEAGRLRSYQDHLDACRADYEAEEKDKKRKMEGLIHNAYPAFGSAEFSGSRGSRGNKSKPLLKSANELGLPLGNNKFIAAQGRKKSWQVPLST